MILKNKFTIESDTVQRAVLVLVILLGTIPLGAESAANDQRSIRHSLLLAQTDGSDAQGTITKEKIKTVVEIKIRQSWRPIPGPDGVFAIVDFRVNSSGHISVCEINKSGGQSAFDQSCLDAVRALGSLPPLPPYLGSELAFFGKFLAGKQPSLEVTLASTGMPSVSAPAMSPPTSSNVAVSSTASTSSNSGSIADSSGGGSSSSPNNPIMAAASPGQSDWVTPQASSSNDGATAGMDMDGLMAAVGGLAQSSGQPQMGGSAQPQMGSGQPQMGGSAQPSKPMPTTSATRPGAPLSTGQKPGGTSAPNSVPPSADLAATLNNLNNQAVIAINDSNYEFAVHKLEEALKMDPTYASAKSNLAIAYNNYALQLQGQNRTEEALKILHRAYAIDPMNEKTRTNLEAIIQIMGKSPASFKDRVDLANRCVTIGDAIGAKIEYEAALAIKKDPLVIERLQALASGRLPQAGGAPTAQAKPKAPGSPPINQPSGQPHAQAQPSQGQPSDTDGGVENISRQPASATSKPASGAVSQKLNTLYKGLSNLEKKTFSRTFETDDILTRLSRVETKLLGKTQTGDPIRRLDTLLLLQ